jgi:hypothetical protein
LCRAAFAFLLLCLNLGEVRPQFTPLGVPRGTATLVQMCELLPDLLGRQDAPDGSPHRLRVALALPALGFSLVGGGCGLWPWQRWCATHSWQLIAPRSPCPSPPTSWPSSRHGPSPAGSRRTFSAATGPSGSVVVQALTGRLGHVSPAPSLSHGWPSRDHVSPSACPGVRALGGNGFNNVGSVGVSIPTRYRDFGSPVSPSGVASRCANQRAGTV